MAIITEDGRFAEYEFGIYCNSITHSIAARIRWMFEGFQITPSTEVIFTKEYGNDEPMYIYFQFLRQHLDFNLRKVKIESMLRTIAKFHGMLYRFKRNEISRNYLEIIWKKVVERNRCPWITTQFDQYLKATIPSKAKERKLLRLSAYYLEILCRQRKIK